MCSIIIQWNGLFVVFACATFIAQVIDNVVSISYHLIWCNPRKYNTHVRRMHHIRTQKCCCSLILCTISAPPPFRSLPFPSYLCVCFFFNPSLRFAFSFQTVLMQFVVLTSSISSLSVAERRLAPSQCYLQMNANEGEWTRSIEKQNFCSHAVITVQVYVLIESSIRMHDTSIRMKCTKWKNTWIYYIHACHDFCYNAVKTMHWIWLRMEFVSHSILCS